MDTVLAGFVRALRGAGVAVSPADSIDAARSLLLLGYGDRANLKAALGVVLAKSDEEKQIHDELFELYFSAPDSGASEANQQQPSAGGPAPDGPPRTGDQAVDALIELAQPSASGGASDALQAALAKAGAQAQVDDIRFVTQSAYLTGQTLAALGVAPLEARLAERMAQSDEAARQEVAQLSRARDALRHHARAYVRQRFELFGKAATESFMTEVAVSRPIGRMAPAEMERMKRLVAQMARKLAQQHSRQQKLQLRGQIDLRRTLRTNAGHDGVPFRLRWKEKRRDRPRIVAVCDVSGSVATHVRFLLLFLYALHDCVQDLKSYAFSSRLKDVSAVMETLPFDEALALILKEVGNGSTDYGQAWQDLHDRHWSAIDRRTTVIVLGDGRSNGSDPRLDLFAELSARAKRVVWLSPEPESRWGTGDSALLRYRPLCTRLSYCASATDLEQVLDEALAAYH